MASHNKGIRHTKGLPQRHRDGLTLRLTKADAAGLGNLHILASIKVSRAPRGAVLASIKVRVQITQTVRAQRAQLEGREPRDPYSSLEGGFL